MVVGLKRDMFFLSNICTAGLFGSVAWIFLCDKTVKACSAHLVVFLSFAGCHTPEIFHGSGSVL
jgi:hypothetical protein